MGNKKSMIEKELVDGMTPYSAHADELAVLSRKECGSINEESEKIICDIPKIIVIDYCATGEGRHVFIKTGLEETIREDMGEWFYQGAEAYTVEQWIQLDKTSPDNISYQNSNIETLKMFAPILWDAMNQGVSMHVDIEYHWNES
ncbi:hypothetical protein [Vibrio sp. 10N.286.48.B7]|uniref:hypothetical protein n=1 Tax=Vibrio sp. 10N.286.48.B7 TaxID=1880853 RepID=UPI001F53DA65|nr:hypothetical protein [Vibrio sp. 10N.286.48.B7]